jgi:putative RNA 2'-phosphotransferase
MDDRDLVRISKFLSKHLRHQPDRLGLILAPGGWVSVDDLLAACAAHGLPLTRAQLDEVVVKNNKQRFSYDNAGTRIRANQGHSVEVDLQLAPAEPPPMLYHGTGERAVAVIQREGLRKLRRHHVHLAADIPTALAVGRRHGRPAVFSVDAAAMHAAGCVFYRSANGVWLVDAVLPQHLGLVATE